MENSNKVSIIEISLSITASVLTIFQFVFSIITYETPNQVYSERTMVFLFVIIFSLLIYNLNRRGSLYDKLMSKIILYGLMIPSIILTIMWFLFSNATGVSGFILISIIFLIVYYFIAIGISVSINFGDDS